MEFNNPSKDPQKGVGYYWLMLKQHWIPASSVFVVAAGLTFAVTSLKKPTYMAEGLLKFEKSSLTSSVTGDVGREISNLEPLVEKSSPLTTEAEVVKSNPVIQETLKRLDLKDAKGKPLSQRDFLAGIKVSEVRGTDILKVTYTDRSPETAAKVVNLLMKVYLEVTNFNHRAKAIEARQFIEKQLPKVESEVSQAEDALRQFRETNQVIALKEESAAAVLALNNLEQQITGIRGQIVDADGEAEMLRSQLGLNARQALPISILSQSPGVQTALKDLQQVEAELAVEQSRLQAEHPKVVSLKEKWTFLNQLIQTRVAQVTGGQGVVDPGDLQMGVLQQDLTKELITVERKREGLARQLLSLSEAQLAYQQRTNLLPKLEKDYRELDRRIEASQVTYAQLLKKIAEIRVAENQTVSNIQIISSAEPPDKATSSKNTGVLAALMMGLLSTAGTLYLLEKRTAKSIKTIDQARNLFGYTLLGVIPVHHKLKPADDSEVNALSDVLVLNDDPASSTSEAYRIINANLKFLSSDRPPTVIIVTSSVAQEGKSTVSANLATLMAQLGRRVLLVDADMHSPSQHRIWDVSNAVGLSNMLVEHVGAPTAIQVVTENLNVLTSGTLPPNSMALLDSERMAKLIEVFGAIYDFVIIDTPPLSLATDALAVGKLADGMLIVVRPDCLDLDSATSTKRLLEQSGQHVLGQVINGVAVKAKPLGKYPLDTERYTQINSPVAEPSKAINPSQNGRVH